MARTTDTAVFEIIDTTLTDIDTFITTANIFVTATLGSSDLGDTVLEEIERYMTAHFLSVKDQRVQAEKIDVLSFTYQGKTGLGLDATQYGQVAQMLDTTGTLAGIAKHGAMKSASISAINLIESPT